MTSVGRRTTWLVLWEFEGYGNESLEFRVWNQVKEVHHTPKMFRPVVKYRNARREPRTINTGKILQLGFVSNAA